DFSQTVDRQDNKRLDKANEEEKKTPESFGSPEQVLVPARCYRLSRAHYCQSASMAEEESDESSFKL
ncbi:hypothetical protein PanWU01x14_245310, partial [Parasponia andersonii]